MNKRAVLKALDEKKTLVWADPCPIEGNDYTIKHIQFYDECDDEATIQYGTDVNMLSEAEIFIHEIRIKD